MLRRPLTPKNAFRIVSAIAATGVGLCAHAGPTLQRISPMVGTQGTETTVLVQGNRLEHIEQVLFYRSGIRFLKATPTFEVPEHRTWQPRIVESGQAALLTIAIAPDCPTGEHLFRIRTRETLSELRSFWVSPFPVVAEEAVGFDDAKSANGSFDTAQPIALNTTVTGYHPAHSVQEDDFYRVELEKGQRLTVEVLGANLVYNYNSQADPAVTIYGPDRHRLARSDDSALLGQDPLLGIIAEQSGSHFINIHPAMETEKSLRHYIAHIGTGHRPLQLFPPGGKAGTTLTARLIGHPGPSRSVDIPLPKHPGEYDASMIPYSPAGAVIPLPVQVSPLPQVIEDAHLHHTTNTAQHISSPLPFALNGIIEHEGKTDWYRFAARKGDRYLIRTYAAALGSPIDANLVIRPAPGTPSTLSITKDDSYWPDRDWPAGGRWSSKDNMDPIVLFEADADGDYLLGLADSQRLFGPDYVYRVEFQPVPNRAQLHVTTDFRESHHKRDSFVIPRGNTIERTLSIVPHPTNTYKGPFRIVAENLPPGVRFNAPTARVDDRIVQVSFTADKEATPEARFITLRLEPLDPGASFSGGYTHHSEGESARGGLIDNTLRTRKCALAIVDPAPFSLHVEQPAIALARNGQIHLDVQVHRVPPFTGAVQVSAKWLPQYVRPPGPLTIPEGETSGKFTLAASDRAVADTYPILLTAHEDLLTHKVPGADITFGTGFHHVASPPISLHIADPYLEIDLGRTAIERQTSATWVGTIKTLRPLPGPCKVRLIRLPNGVALTSEPTIKPGDTEVRFPIRVSADALTGQAREISCQISIQENGQSITQQTGNGTLRIDAERQ